MKTLADIIVEAQQVVSDLQALPTAPVVTPTDVEVDIVLSDGTTKKFVPQTDLPAPEPTA